MTKLNLAELAKTANVARALIWAVLELRRANSDIDNAGWLQSIYKGTPSQISGIEIIPPAEGETIGQIRFWAILPYNNLLPLLSRPGWISSIRPYTDYQIPLPHPIPQSPAGGVPIGNVPAAIDSLERAIAWLAGIWLVLLNCWEWHHSYSLVPSQFRIPEIKPAIANPIVNDEHPRWEGSGLPLAVAINPQQETTALGLTIDGAPSGGDLAISLGIYGRAKNADYDDREISPIAHIPTSVD